MSVYVDFHALQPVPPSCINRDDTGNPKTANFGGVQRARVSSQAWKHAIRDAFARELPELDLGVRTKHVVQLISEAIIEKAPEYREESSEYAREILETINENKNKKQQPVTKQDAGSGEYLTKSLFFISNTTISDLADLAVTALRNGQSAADMKNSVKEDAQKAFLGKQAVDVALFGRMLADAPSLNADASCQVAHAISVDELTPEYDYFTAMDDKAAEDNAGAAMIETNAFNSGTFYRFATVNASALEKQLAAEDTSGVQSTAVAIAAFAKAFLESMPTGKINSYANQTLPSTVLVTVRNTRPVNLVTAFQLPVRSDGTESVAHIAAQKLLDENDKFNSVYGDKPLHTYLMTIEDGLNGTDEVQTVTLQELQDALKTDIPQALGQE